MIKNADGYNDPTVDKAFSNVLKKPESEQELKALARLKKLMRFLRFTAGEFGFYLGIGAMSGVSLVYLAFKALIVIVHEMIWR